MLKTKTYTALLYFALFLIASIILLTLNKQTTYAIECNGTTTTEDCPVIEQGPRITGNYRTAIGGIGMYPQEDTESFVMNIPNCTSGAPTIIRATAYWMMRDFDDLSYWEESVDIARNANPATTVASDRRYKVNMGGGAGSSYISDITTDGIVAAGNNTYTITNFDVSPGASNPATSQWGFGIQVIYECPEYSTVHIQQLEGHDSHWYNWFNGWDTDRSELICEQFVSSISSRDLSLDTFMTGSTDPTVRQADIWYTTGTGTMPSRTAYDLLTDVNSPANGGIILDRLAITGEGELGVYQNTITIPAGDEYVCFQVDSSFDVGEHPDNASVFGASMYTGLQWISYEVEEAPAATVSLGNTVWEDVNNNGLLDGSETGICSVEVHLYQDTDSDGKYTQAAEGTTPLATTTTACGASAGQYSFSSLTPGEYIVLIPQDQFDDGAALSGYVSSTGTNGSGTGPYEAAPDPDNNINNDDNGYTIEGIGVASCAVTLGAGEEPTDDGDADNNSNLSVDFGLFQQAKLGNFVWSDVNSNGIQDTDEIGIPNATATLYNAADDSVVAVTITNTEGIYNFCYLIPGSYYVIFSDLPDGAVITQVDSGDDDEGDSDVGASTLRTRDYDLVAGQTEYSVDAGVILRLASTGLNTTAKIYSGIVLAGVAMVVTKAKGGSIYRTRRSLSF